jgi:hypothetical protein
MWWAIMCNYSNQCTSCYSLTENLVKYYSTQWPDVRIGRCMGNHH